MRLMTRKEYNALTPEAKGYVSYMQAAWPGSKVPEKCPYPKGSSEHKMWTEGNFKAMLSVQDAEE